MTRLAAVEDALAAHGLAVVGGFHAGPADGTPATTKTLLLVGADGGRMWEVVSQSPEYADGGPNPLDRWSRRVLDNAAAEFGAEARYPFGGPPYEPFIRWAGRGEGMHPSPIFMPVSPRRGLSASYRGALCFANRLPLPDWDFSSPCAECPAPCLAACPVDAFAGGAYDVPACVSHLASDPAVPCHGGCLARMACPVGTLPPEPQRRFHMAAFLAARLADAT